MDRSSNTTAPSQARPAHRDMMFCHECADEWYRDEQGLTCPECGSDFTEIIEENNDPRDSVMFGDDGDDNESMPDLEQTPAHINPQLNLQHNPWQSDDPEEGDISNVRYTQTAPGRFSLQATYTRSVSPQTASIGGFMNLLNGIVGTAVRPQGQTLGSSQPSGPTAGQNQNESAFQEARGQGAEGQNPLRTGRFTYHGGARLYPRDANNPQPHIEPVDNLADVMTGLMAALGAPPGSVHAGQHPEGGAQATFRGIHNPDEAQMQASPFFQLFSSMGLMGPGGQMGDFVYSQEGLDRIVSQLMEQTATSNAPGPAAPNDIDSLARREVTEDMLGPEHTAECSICMDEVTVGEQVTVLPCKHWFHHQCVSAWLAEHDTCPHCRKGISKRSDGEANEQTASGAQADRTTQMPGSFNYSGAGSSNDPFVVQGEAGSSNNRGTSPGNAAGDGSFADRIHRGLFGPQR